MGVGDVTEASRASLQHEIDFLKNGQNKGQLFRGQPCKASAAADELKKFTEEWPDPFKPNYAYANPWAQKKENKGKKERPAGPVRPKRNEVAL